MALYILEFRLSALVSTIFHVLLYDRKGYTDIHTIAHFVLFQHWISCQVHDCRIDKGLYIKLMSIWRFHDT